MEARRKGGGIFLSASREIKIFADEGKLREFVTNRHAPQERLEEVFQTEK